MSITGLTKPWSWVGNGIIRVFLADSTSSAHAGLTGLAYNTANLIIAAAKDMEATTTAYTAAASKIEDITTLGTYAAPSATKCRFKEFDATNHPGIYELQFSTDLFNEVTGGVYQEALLISITGAADLADTNVEIDLGDVAASINMSGAKNVLAGSLAEYVRFIRAGMQYSVERGLSHLAAKPVGGSDVDDTSTITFSENITGTGSIDIDGVYWEMQSGSESNQEGQADRTKSDDLWTIDSSGASAAEWSGSANFDAMYLTVAGGDGGVPEGVLNFTISNNALGTYEFSVKIQPATAGKTYRSFISNTGNLAPEAYNATASEITTQPAGIWRHVIESTNSITAEQIMRAVLAFVAGDRAGGGTPTITFKRPDNLTNAILMQNVDADGNTTTVTLDLD